MAKPLDDNSYSDVSITGEMIMTHSEALNK